ncbi:D-2-hydroxyacid dehydrogenase [Williamsia sp. CHRR-6]|nr:D-2-hydroxyacid dehydrogenase [Williamsia sp. CHRR-6]MBT0566215.1 D-2-hydroxyacid dehydrogenase [Williamsia sp. CHRR-6]
MLTRPGEPLPYNMAEIEALASVTVATAADLGTALPGADALFLWENDPVAIRENWSAAVDLRWLHVSAAGVDKLMFDELRASPVVVTNSRGVYDRPIAEFVLASIMAWDKRLLESRDLQRQRRWQWRETRRTTGSSALVVGTGAIGREIARLLSAAGLHVRGAGRVPRSDDPDFGAVIATADLADHVGDVDNLVLIAPLTDQTRGLVDGHVLAAMKPSAHLINVGRGHLVVETDLVAALQAGTIAAASLDVAEVEPLPADSPLWTLPQVSLSAHMSGDVTGWREALADQFLRRLRTYAAGEPLVGAVDTSVGYVR